MALDVGFMRPLLVWRGYWIDEGYVMSEWIKCSDRFPQAETNSDVLVYCADTKEQFVGFHIGHGDFQFFAMDEVMGSCHPTHWMPLPEPPAD